jgi:copper chaperone CopZ
MKRLALFSLAIAAAVLAADQSLSLKVDGWHSKGDVYKTEQAVQGVKGVKGVTSDLSTKTLTVTFDDVATNAAAIQKAISSAGYVSRR